MASASKPLLSDMAWTAGVGRSHFDYRASSVFHDVESLQEQLSELAETGADMKPRACHQCSVRLHGAGEPVGRYGADSLRERAGGEGGYGPLRGGIQGRKG